MTDKNILITGSNGFIGSNLLRYSKEIINYCLIDIKTGFDIRYIEKCTYEPNIIIHLAAETSVYNTNLERIAETNIVGFVKVLEFAKKHNAKLIYASSSTANNITSLYGISKYCNEYIAKTYYDNAVGIRFHNVYGDNVRKDTLLGMINNNEKIVLFNNGTNKRHFTHVENVIECIDYCIANDVKGLINVFNPKTNTTLEFTEECTKYKDFKIELTNDIPKYDKEYQVTDDSLQNFHTEYINIKEGIYKYFKNKNK